MHYLVTGTAGFIGYHVAERLLARGDQVTGLDNVNDYYDVRLKHARTTLYAANGATQRLEGKPGYAFIKLDVSDDDGMARVFAERKPEVVIHLAAQAGVRYSLTNPHAYVQSNLAGFMNILEGCRHQKVRHLVYASSSSVYGGNTRQPFSIHIRLCQQHIPGG